MTQIQTNVNNQNIISTQLQMIKNFSNNNANGVNPITTCATSNNNMNNNNSMLASNLPNFSGLQNNQFNYLDIAGLINQAKENELAIRHQSLQRALSAENNLNKIEFAKNILDQTRNQFQQQQVVEQHQQPQQQQPQQQQPQQQQLQQQSQQANSIEATPPTP